MIRWMRYLLAMALCVLSVNAFAQAWPSRPITWIVPYPAGGVTDAPSRAVAKRVSEILGTPVSVENKAGAAGMIGTEQVTKADPDGHVLLGHTSSYPGTAAVRAKLPFDPARAIIPVGGIGKSALILVVHPL